MMKYTNPYEDYFLPNAQIYHLTYDTKNNTYVADVFNGTITFAQSIVKLDSISLDNDIPLLSKTLDEDFLMNAYKVSGKDPNKKRDCFNDCWFAICKEKEIKENAIPLNDTFYLIKDKNNSFLMDNGFSHSFAYVCKTNPLLVSAAILIIAITIYMAKIGWY